MARTSVPVRLTTCLALLLSSAVRGESQAPNPSAPAPPGILVDVGGYRVHLYCAGKGNPTVMIVGGAFSFDWGLVQPEVARFTRVCTFDPSGTAWSDPFGVTASAFSSRTTPVKEPLPTCEDRVDEIHRLITKTPINGPYVLVGFSVLGYHLKTGHTLSVQNRPTGLAADVIVLPCHSVRLQGLGLSPRSGV